MTTNKDELKNAGEYVNGELIAMMAEYGLGPIECPICGKTLFSEEATYEECEVCGFFNDEDTEEVIAAKNNESESVYWKEKYTGMVSNYKRYGNVRGEKNETKQ